MRRVVLALCCMALSACSAIPGISRPTDPVNRLSLKSNPPGAEARVSSGASCRTPCTLPVKVSDYNVTFALAGYAPRFIPIRVWMKREHWYSAEVTYVVPNPLVVQLEPVTEKPSKATLPPAQR